MTLTADFVNKNPVKKFRANVCQIFYKIRTICIRVKSLKNTFMIEKNYNQLLYIHVLLIIIDIISVYCYKIAIKFFVSSTNV